MKRYLRLIFSLLLFCVSLNSEAQSGATPNSYLTNFVTPAPNAASLGKYADFPVSYFTGVPQISIPIYDLKDGGIDLPISLSYHASGIHVSELASWVGLGWALNAGGVILRTVRGEPDEGVHNAGGVPGPTGYYSDSGLTHLPKLPYPISGQSSDPGNIFYGEVTPSILAGQKDCEPDLFTFNFNGHVGKFVFDESQNARLLEDDNLTIKVSFSTASGYGTFNSWKITTADGIEYYFGENNANETTFPSSTLSGSDIYNGYAPSSWYLTRIINPSTKDTATFNYTRETYAYKDLGPESTLFSNGNDIFNACSDGTINGGTSNPGVQNMITTSITGLRLTSIVTKNYTVNFIAKNPRADLLNNSGAEISATNSFSLDSIKIFTNPNTCVKQFALGHTYFNSSAATGASITATLINTGHPSPDVTDTKRLKLASVQEYSGDGTISKPAYLLTYQETYPGYTGFQLPRRLSYDQDHWGYANNAPGTNNNYFTPPVFYPSCTAPGGGAYRHPKWPDMLAFTLTGVQDPLGVSTTFIYGPNTAANGMDVDVSPSVPDTLVGGLKILQIKTKDNVTNKVQVRSFSYGTSGSLFKLPTYLIPMQNEYYSAELAAGGLADQPGGYVGNFGNISLILLLRQSQGIVPMQDEQGNTVTYQTVKESFGPSGQGGYKIYQFSNYLSPFQTTSRLHPNNFITSGTIAGVPSLYGNGLWNEILPQNLYPDSPSPSAGCYPFTPDQVDLSGGKLLEQDTYDSANNLLEKITNNYSYTYHNNYSIRGLKVYLPLAPSALNALSFYKLNTGIAHLASSVKQTYLNAHVVSDSTSYGYESTHHTLSTSDTTVNSTGDKYVHKNYYSFDYSNTATTDGVFGKMKGQNLLLPVSTQTWKNGSLISGRISQFKDFSGIIGDTTVHPAQVYALETNAPLTASQAGVSTTWADQSTLLPGAYFKPRADFNFNGVTSKPVNEQLTGGSNVSYQWGYNNTYPVAKVQNAADNTIETGTQSTQNIVTVLPMGSTSTYTIPFTIVGGGNVTIQLGFAGNPGTNAMAEVGYQVTGPNGTVQDPLPVCVSVGTGSCGSYNSSYTINSLPAGSYTLTAHYLATTTLTCNTNFTIFYPSQSATVTGIKEFFYEGFEDNTSAITGAAHTGTKFYNGGYIVHWTKPNARVYVITYWYLVNGIWTYKPESTYTGPSLALTGGTAYDDVRIYPSDAQMSTYTYDPAAGMTSSTDAKGETTYYEYDSFQRLSNIKDQNGSIIKNYCYNYAGQPSGCPVTTNLSAASVSNSSFVSTDPMDNEWKQEAPPGYTVAADNGTTINAAANAGANAGRFAYFSTGGSLATPIVGISGNLTFTAKGSGTIEVQLIATYNTSIVQRQTFTLTSSYQNFSMAIPSLYPQLEMIAAIIVNGGNSSSQASVQIQKNFSLNLIQENLTTPYIRFRADSASMIGNTEKEWYGWNDTYNAPRKKYLQHSAFARMRFQTDARKFAIEYVRDFYDKRVVNLFNVQQQKDSTDFDSNGNVISGLNATNTYTKVTGGLYYTISGLLTTNPTYVWYNNVGTPLGAPQTLSNMGTVANPVYQIQAPATATSLGLLIQRDNNGANDVYFVYTNCMIQQGTINEQTPLDGTIPSVFTPFSGYTPSYISGPAVFINGKLYKYYQVEGTDIAKVIQFVTDTLPAGNKTVEVMMPGQGAYLSADPHIRRSGNYLRAVYFPGSSTFVYPATTIAPGSVAYVHDSILTGYYLSSDAQNNVWMMMTQRDPSYGFKGDIFSDGYAGRVLYTDISTPALTTALATKLAAFGVDKYWFQVGVNDYGYNTPLPKFYLNYKSLIEQLKVLRPNAKMYIQCIGPVSFGGPNGETMADNGFSGSGPAANDFRDVQRAIATSHSYCEYVNFENLFSPVPANTADGLHPTDAGNILYANGIKNNSTLLGTAQPVTPLTYYRSTTRPFIVTVPGIFTITGTGGKAPYVFTKLSGTLPAGLTFNADGTITGTTSTSGTFSISVKITDAAAATVTQTFSIVVSPVPTIIVAPIHIIAAQTGVLYSKLFKASSGYGPYTLAISASTLPATITFNPTTGVLSGTPTVAGTYTFKITATDHWGFTGVSSYTLTVGTGAPTPLTDSFVLTATLSGNNIVVTGHLHDIYDQNFSSYIYAYTVQNGVQIAIGGGIIYVNAGGMSGPPFTIPGINPANGPVSSIILNIGSISPNPLDAVNITFSAFTTITP